MIFYGDMTLVSLTEKESKKGNKYLVGLFIQDSNAMSLMIPDDIPVQLQLYTDYNVGLAYNAQFKQFKIISIS